MKIKPILIGSKKRNRKKRATKSKNRIVRKPIKNKVSKNTNSDIHLFGERSIIFEFLLVVSFIFIYLFIISRMDFGDHEERLSYEHTEHLVIIEPNRGYKGIDSYKVFTFRDKEECLTINPNRVKIMGVYNSRFKISCDEIMENTLSFHDKYNKEERNIAGFSVITATPIERYHPVYNNNNGDLVYIGGLPATYDYNVISKVNNELGYNIDMFNDSYVLAGVD